MERERLLGLLTDIAEPYSRDGQPSALDLLCTHCVAVLPITSAGIFLMSEGEHRGAISASDGLALQVEEVEDTADEGPCLEAYRTGEVVREPDLAARGRERWPRFTERALATGIAAAFSAPLTVAGLRFGAIDLFRDQPGDLDERQVADMQVLADLAAYIILDAQSHAAPGELADALLQPSGGRERVEQAKGMVAVQLGVPVTVATQRMRAAADAEARSLYTLADEILAGTRRL